MTQTETKASAPIILDARVALDKIPSKGRRLRINASTDQLAELTDIIGVSAVRDFSAELHIESIHRGFRVSGQFKATVEQPCVVTLDPLEQTIDEPIDRLFQPEPVQDEEPAPGSEVYIDLEGEDLPDYFSGTELDLSALLLELLTLSVDMYPRAPGAELKDGRAGDDLAEQGPFAALKALKTKDE